MMSAMYVDSTYTLRAEQVMDHLCEDDNAFAQHFHDKFKQELPDALEDDLHTSSTRRMRDLLALP